MLDGVTASGHWPVSTRPSRPSSVGWTRGVRADTTIIFTSDNGVFHGEHRVPDGKYLPYDPAARVPLLIRGPMVPDTLEGTTSTAPVVNVDLAPTILDYAGVEPMAPVDGRSLRPLLEGTGPVWQGRGDVWRPSTVRSRPVYVMGVGIRSRQWVTYSGVRSGARWLYVRWESDPATTELYDLRADPAQLENLAGRQAHARVEGRLERQRRLLVGCAGRSCDVPPFGYLDLPTSGVAPWLSAARWADSVPLGVAFDDGTFRPGAAARRAHLLLWLWRLDGAPVVGGRAHSFDDVPRRLAAAVNWAIARGLVGAREHRFRPAGTVSRAQWALWLWRAEGEPLAAPGSPLPGDVAADHRAAEAVRWLVSDPDGGAPLEPIGAVREDGSFLPDSPVRRSAAVSWLHRSARSD